ncbi:hypothetical protein A6R68_23191 [Neotoma lepida]|uniref:SH2 domain-containing protein n=1 Tax=Neotoma lepida TaxID=56216 RepID=A0A1A6HYM2_NEOLE|nr:hypothetical protein A6R68_23191 [Neotoma lepida]
MTPEAGAHPDPAAGSTKFKKFVYTYRIFREKHGYYKIQTAEGVPRQIFPNLEELISKYEKPGQGLVVHLSNPIMRNSFYPRGRGLKAEQNVYDEKSSKQQREDHRK